MHPEEFASRKSVVLVHGTVGFRTGQPALKTVAGVTWEKVLAALKRRAPEFVRVKEQPDKEALLELPPERLESFGLRVEQAERFFAEMNKEAVRTA